RTSAPAWSAWSDMPRPRHRLSLHPMSALVAPMQRRPSADANTSAWHQHANIRVAACGGVTASGARDRQGRARHDESRGTARAARGRGLAQSEALWAQTVKDGVEEAIPHP